MNETPKPLTDADIIDWLEEHATRGSSCRFVELQLFAGETLREAVAREMRERANANAGERPFLA